MVEKSYKREVACKVKISDLINNTFIRNEGFEPSYVLVGIKKISRVNVIGVITEKKVSERIVNIIVDDSYGIITSTFFDNIEHISNNFSVGDVVVIIGRVNDFNGIKINGEIIRKIDRDWIDVRKKEVEQNIKNYVVENKDMQVNEKQMKIEQDLFSDEVDLSQKQIVVKSPYQQIWQIIKDNDLGSGVDFDMIKENNKTMSDEKIEEICQNLLKEGEIYEIKAGYYKVLE